MEIKVKNKYLVPKPSSRFKSKPHAGNTSGGTKYRKKPHLCKGGGTGISRRVR